MKINLLIIFFISFLIHDVYSCATTEFCYINQNYSGYFSGGSFYNPGGDDWENPNYLNYDERLQISCGMVDFPRSVWVMNQLSGSPLNNVKLHHSFYNDSTETLYFCIVSNIQTTSSSTQRTFYFELLPQGKFVWTLDLPDDFLFAETTQQFYSMTYPPADVPLYDPDYSDLDCWLDWTLECGDYTASVCDYSFKELADCYLNKFQTTDIFGVTDGLESVSLLGNSKFTFNTENYGSPEFDFNDIKSNFSFLKYVFLIVASWVALTILYRNTDNG